METKDRSATPSNTLRVEVRSEAEIFTLRRKVKALMRGHCSPEEQAEVVTAILELAVNALRYAGSGNLSVQINGDRLIVICEDHGPGILEWDTKKYQVLEMNDSKSLGFGLGIISRLMDTVEIDTQAGEGTRIIMKRHLGVRTGPTPLSAKEISWKARSINNGQEK